MLRTPCRVAVVAALVLVSAALSACLRSPSFRCESDAQCVSDEEQGTCTQVKGVGYCAFRDTECPSGLRFDDNADGQSGVCVVGEAPPPPPPADRGLCHQSAARARTENTCVAAVCDKLPLCCSSSWTSQCVQLVEVQCKRPCGDRAAFVGNDAIVVVDYQDGAWRVAAQGGVAQQRYASASWADFDEDGSEELLVSVANFDGTNGSDQGIWSLQPGAPAQLRPYFDLLSLPTPNPFVSYLGIDTVVGDRDHDGDLDLGVVGQFPSAVLADYVGRGQLVAGPDLEGPDVPDNFEQMTGSGDLGDFDGDGDLDLALGDYNTGLVAVFDLAKTPRALWSRDLGDFNIRRLAWGDVDGDGDLDLAVVGIHKLQVLANTGGAFAEEPVFNRTSTIEDVTDALWIDADGDGDQDLMTSNSESDGEPLRLFVNDRGLLPNPSWMSREQVDGWRLDAGDFDGDGDLDVAVAVVGKNRIFANNGDNTFSLAWTAETDGNFRGVDVTSR